MNYDQFLSLYTHMPAYSTHETKYNSFNMGKYINDNNISGDVIECGVAAGANLACMMLGCNNSKTVTNRTYWGFDSYQGIQLAGKKDTDQPGIGAITHNTNVSDDELLVSSGITVHSKDSVIAFLTQYGLYNSKYVKLVEGWIQKTITENIVKEIGKIALLRLDMDIYSPTKFALDKLYPLISKGGVVIIDDWALDGARLACTEYFKEHNLSPEIHTVLNSTPTYFFKQS